MSDFFNPLKWHTPLDVTPPTGEVESMELDPDGETTDEESEEEEEDTGDEDASQNGKRSLPTPTSPTPSDRHTKAARHQSRA